MATDDSSPTVNLISPQTNQAINVGNPTHIDDTATFTYATSATFTITSYTTAIQSTTSITSPAALNGNLVPSSSPFILQVVGSGFNSVSAIANPFLIFANIGSYYAIIPPLPDTTNLTQGNAYGYSIKSDTSLWIYFTQLLGQQIWFQPSNFTGADSSTHIAIETGNHSYPFLDDSIDQLELYFAANVNFKQRPNVISSISTNLSIPITQTPYVITNVGVVVGSTFVPFAANTSNDKVSNYITFYGHDVNESVLFVSANSQLLKQNPSQLPASVLNADQSTTAIQSMTLAQIQALEYFKQGYFLGDIVVSEPITISNYNYRAPDGTIQTSGASNSIPDPLSTNTITINTLPPGQYLVVVYDAVLGTYSVAPNGITYTGSNNAQIHDITPNPINLQSPTFTINGFGLPTTTDLQNGTSVELRISDQNGAPLFGNTGILQVNQSSPSADINGRGSISLISNSKMTATFTGLQLPTTLPSNIFLTLDTFAISGGSNTPGVALHNLAISPSVMVSIPPVISFFTNQDAQPELATSSGDGEDAAATQSLVRINQTTGQVIAYGDAGANLLYIVGQNFGTRSKVSVLIGGQKQIVSDLIAWTHGTIPNLSAVVVQTQANNSIKGDAIVQVMNGSLSSDPIVLKQPTPYVFPVINQTKQQNGAVLSKTVFNLSTDLFSNSIPYLSNTYNLISSQAKVSSSLAVSLQNSETKQTLNLTASLTTQQPITFLPDTIAIPANTPLASDGTFNITFNFYGAFNVNFSSPKIVALEHDDGSTSASFNANEIMTVVGTGFVDGMRYNINNTSWKVAPDIFPLDDGTDNQAFQITLPPPLANTKPSLQISSDMASSVSSIQTAGLQNGTYKNSTTVVNDRYSPLLQINQRLPAGIKLYANGSQAIMTDIIDANISIYGQMAPFLSGFKTMLIIIRVIVCIIDVICALINPFKLIVAIIALMDCIIDLLSLFPQLAVPIMILSFLQNFAQFLTTFITQIEAYVLSIVNSQLALAEAQLNKDFALLAAAEQQAFAAVKQINDAIAFLQPALQIIQTFESLLNFAMHFPCASNQGNNCPQNNFQDLIKNMVGNQTVASNKYTASAGNMVRNNGIVSVATTTASMVSVGDQIVLSPGENDFTAGTKTVATVIDTTHFTYLEMGTNAISTIDETIGTLINPDQQQTLLTMLCQGMGTQTATLNTIPGFNNISNGIPTSSVVPPVNPTLPDVSGTINCMTNITSNIETALNNGQIFITSAEQGQQLVNAYTQCIQGLMNQTSTAITDACALSVSALNSELTVSPMGNVGPDLSDDFVRTQIPLPNTNPTDDQGAGLVIDLATIIAPANIPSSISTNPATNTQDATTNFGTKQDIYSPVIVQTNNQSGQRQSIDTIYFDAGNSDVGTLISVGDIFQFVGGTFDGLQFPILAIQPIFTAVILTVKLDITPEQELLVGQQKIPENISGFDVKVIAHLAGNDAVAVVPADNVSVATINIIPRDHSGHYIGSGLANNIAITIESGSAEFVPITPSTTTDITGTIQTGTTSYFANLKSNCSGTVICSASVCGITFAEIGYEASDPNHTIITRTMTVRVIFVPPTPPPAPNAFSVNAKPQVPGTNLPN